MSTTDTAPGVGDRNISATSDILPETESFTDGWMELLVLGVATAIAQRQAIEQLNEEMAVVVEQTTIFDQHSDRIDRIESELDTLEDLRLTNRSLVKNLADQARITDELTNRVEALEGIFSSRVVEKERAHNTAIKRDPRDIVQPGETRTLYIEEILNDNRTALGHIEGLVTFVKLTDSDSIVSSGEAIEVVITDTQDTCAHARAVEGQ